MIHLDCPHCHRILKIPERYSGLEGACNFCGGRIVVELSSPIPGDVPRSEGEPSSNRAQRRAKEENPESLRAAVGHLATQLARAQSELEHALRELVAETSAKVDAQIARDMAETRVLRLEEQLASELEAERTARVKAEETVEALEERLRLSGDGPS